MEGFIERIFLVGLGTIVLTKEKAEEIVGYLIKKGESPKRIK